MLVLLLKIQVKSSANFQLFLCCLGNMFSPRKIKFPHGCDSDSWDFSCEDTPIETFSS